MVLTRVLAEERDAMHFHVFVIGLGTIPVAQCGVSSAQTYIILRRFGRAKRSVPRYFVGDPTAKT